MSDMANDKTLYLHIGAGKTGSSALQVWLNHHADALRKLGVHYPTWGAKLDDYAITSGNGRRLIEAVGRGEMAPFLADLAKANSQKLFLSSESFQGFTDENLRELKNEAARIGLRVTIIVYLRDVYDVMYSAYQQMIKRHLGTQTFREFALKRDKVQQFEVVAAYSRHFDDMRVFHYDSERKRGLEVAMCEALGVDPAEVPPMPNTKVNRSLDVGEAEWLRLLNQAYVQNFPGGSTMFSVRNSDALIYADPEHETDILLDERVMRHLEALCRRAVDDLNTRYLQKTPLKIFDPTGKNVIREVRPVDKLYAVTIESAVKFVANQGQATVPQAGENHRRAGPAATGEPLACSDPRLINALRDEAIRVEKTDLPRALALMRAAAVLRPNGAGIKKKLEEYQASIQ